MVVQKNVSTRTGYRMKRGLIFVEGDAGDDTGENMEGGTIIVLGKIGSISTSCNGRIYERSKQVWPKKS